MKHIVKLSSITATCGLGLFLAGCDDKSICDKYKPPLIYQEECTEQQIPYNHTHQTGFFAPTYLLYTTTYGG